jgi:hypothetical protein
MDEEIVMAEWFGKLLVAGIAILVIWSVLKSRYAFEISIKGGKPHIRKGKVTSAFLASVTDACLESGVTLGWIGGVPHGRRVALRFSRHFSPGLQQRLRNEWLAAY